jgi:hypothetical protein
MTCALGTALFPHVTHEDDKVQGGKNLAWFQAGDSVPAGPEPKPRFFTSPLEVVLLNYSHTQAFTQGSEGRGPTPNPTS